MLFIAELLSKFIKNYFSLTERDEISSSVT